MDFSRSKCAGNKAVFARFDMTIAHLEPKSAKTRPPSQRKKEKVAQKDPAGSSVGRDFYVPSTLTVGSDDSSDAVFDMHFLAQLMLLQLRK